MSLTYGRLLAADESAAVAWWAAAFGDHPAIIATALFTAPGSHSWLLDQF
jgi:hypothetical protein